MNNELLETQLEEITSGIESNEQELAQLGRNFQPGLEWIARVEHVKSTIERLKASKSEIQQKLWLLQARSRREVVFGRTMMMSIDRNLDGRYKVLRPKPSDDSK